MGWKNVRDCAEWLSGIDWNIGLDQEDQNLAGRMELLVTEVLEGLRPEAEFWQEASQFVTSESGLLYGQPFSILQRQVVGSSNDRGDPIVEIMWEAELAGVGSLSSSI